MWKITGGQIRPATRERLSTELAIRCNFLLTDLSDTLMVPEYYKILWCGDGRHVAHTTAGTPQSA